MFQQIGRRLTSSLGIHDVTNLESFKLLKANDSFDLTRFIVGSYGRHDHKLNNLIVMVLKDKQTGYYGAVPVPQKGVDPHEYNARQLLRFLEYLGYNELILKSDQ